MTLLQTYRGDTANFTVTLTDSTGQPLDLAGLNVTFAATRMYRDAPFLVKTIDNGGIDIAASGSGSGDSGVCTVIIEPADTASLTHTERFVWGISVDNGIDIETPLRGRWVVMLNVNAMGGVSLGPTYGEIVITGNAAPLTMTTQDVWYPVTTGWAADKHRNTTLNAALGSIMVGVTGEYATLCTIAFTSSETPQTVEFGLFRNGVLIPDHKAVTWLDTTSFPNTVTISGIDDVNNGGVLDLRVRCTTASGKVLTVTDANFSVFSLA